MLQIISNYIGILIVGLGEVFFAKVVLNKKLERSKLQSVVIFLLSVAVCTIAYLYLKELKKTALLCIIHMVEFKLLFKISYSKAIFLTFMYAIVALIPDIINLLLVTKIIGIDRITVYNEFAGSLISNIIIFVLLLVTTIILKKPLRKLINTEISNNTKIVILSFCSLACIGMFFYTFNREFKLSGNSMKYLIVVVVLIIIILSLIKQAIDNSILHKEYEKMMECMKKYEVEVEKQKMLKHETTNSYLAIKAKIQDKEENGKIINFIDELLKEKIEVKQEKYSKFGYLPANGIKGLCYFKVQEAEDKGIKVSLNISKKVENSTIYSLSVKQEKDLGKILGVFLDNAIEASLESDEKQLGLEVYANKEKEVKIIISNTYKNEIDKNKIGKEIYSSKGKERGHGLLLVKHIVRMNNIFETFSETHENIFVQTLVIKK